MTPVYTARTSFLPPQQQQSGMASALASLGGLAGLAGAAGAIKSPADQYVALMQSVSATDRLIDQFELMKVYESKYRFEARRALEQNTRIAVGKKDGLISVEVDDENPQRAAEMANAYVEELRRMTSVLAVSEAQQRRMFFEKELKDARDQLEKAQQALQASGFNVGALRAEPRAAAESYARLKAEITAAEVRTQVLRGSLADSAPEVQRQLAQLSALRAPAGAAGAGHRHQRRPRLPDEVPRVQVPRDAVRAVCAAVRDRARRRKPRGRADPGRRRRRAAGIQEQAEAAVHRRGGHAAEPAAAGHVHPGAPLLARDRGRPGRRREGGALRAAFGRR